MSNDMSNESGKSHAVWVYRNLIEGSWLESSRLVVLNQGQGQGQSQSQSVEQTYTPEA